MHVEIDGPPDGVAVVFLHGVTSSGKAWGWLPETMTRGRRIVRLDLRGHGRSDHAPGTYDLARYGGDLVAVLREVTARPAVLVGHSLGGVVAWWLAQNHPELVAAALLEDPPLLAAHTPEPEVRRFRDHFHPVRERVLEYRVCGLSDEEVEERVAATRAGPGGTTTSDSSSWTTRSRLSPSATGASTSA